MGFLSKTADTFYAFRFLRLLTTPWEKTGAFKAGLIDENGRVIKSPQTSDEKSVFNLFHKLVFNVKRLLNKIPFGKSTIASYLTALYLIKEETGMSDLEMLNVINTSQQINIDSFSLNENNDGGGGDDDDTVYSGQYKLENTICFTNSLFNEFTNPDSIIEVSEDLKPIGFIFNYPIYEVNYDGKPIKVSHKDLQKIS